MHQYKMGRRHQKGRNRNQRENNRDRQDQRNQQDGERNARGDYKLTSKENEMFETYYKGQNLMPESEFEEFMSALRTTLPATFRITGYRSEAKELLKVIESTYLQNLVKVEVDGINLDPPKCLEWYPDRLAWQLSLDRKAIRNCDALEKLKNFLVSETESGNISRQEAVSMIPPLLLDIKPHHRVLDMCAAPGSKTAQLVEFLHADENIILPEGFVIANDSDNKRCYLMVHQVKRLASPCFMIVNHDASQLPNLRLNPFTESPAKWLNFDRILADVPCSGDGTMRKNPDVWRKWNAAIGHNLHGLQSRILKRGLELLTVGGRLVYSTCSFNPIENEAVIANMLGKCEGNIELVDVSSELPGLKRAEGLSEWKVMNRKTCEWYNKFEDVPEELATQIRPTMFPPQSEHILKELKKCVRILPHHQDTGGFFIAVIKKVNQVPWFNKNKRKAEETKEGTDKPIITSGQTSYLQTDGVVDNQDGKKSEVKDCTKENKEESEVKDGTEENKKVCNKIEERETKNEDVNLAKEKNEEGTSKEGEAGSKRTANSEEIFEPQQKKRKLHGYKEDPFIYLPSTDPVWPSVKEFYGVEDSFPIEQLMVRTSEGKKRNIYFSSKEIKHIVQHNEDRIKFINLGIKMLNRSESIHTKCDFRLVQEGILMIEPYITKRRVTIKKEDILTILGQENPFITKCEETTQTQLQLLDQGGCLFTYEPDEREDSPQCRLIFCGWVGKASTRSFLPKYQRAHFLRLCGEELREKGENESTSKEKSFDPFGEEKSTDEDGTKKTSVGNASQSEKDTENVITSQSKKEENGSSLETNSVPNSENLGTIK